MAFSPRYHRQALLPQIGAAGQEKLAAARVLLVGCGALGCAIAQSLARAGVGHLRIVDRDVVDPTNLHRQVLFTNDHALNQMPKAIAAADVLAAANPEIRIEPIVADVNAQNIVDLARDADFHAHLILDGTDNAQTRYLINDLAVREKVPWVYGACVGTEGRVLVIRPGITPCLRCLFPEMPAPGELATCDTAGVLGPAAVVIGALQAAQAIRLLIEGSAALEMLAADLWTMKMRSVNVAGARTPDCPCCGKGELQFLNRPPRLDTAALCGRDAVQIRSMASARLDLPSVAARLRSLGELMEHEAFLRFRPADAPALTLSVFQDGRVIVNGTTDLGIARSLVARYIGS